MLNSIQQMLNSKVLIILEGYRKLLEFIWKISVLFKIIFKTDLF